MPFPRRLYFTAPGRKNLQEERSHRRWRSPNRARASTHFWLCCPVFRVMAGSKQAALFLMEHPPPFSLLPVYFQALLP